MAYELVPAAMSWNTYSGLGIYVKWQGGAANKITVLDAGPRYAEIQCPDRRLLLVRDGHNSRGAYGTEYDTFYDLNLFEPSVAQAFGLRIMMTNSVHEDQKNRLIGNRLNGRPTGHPEIMTDSGGFQLITDRASWIDPIDLVNGYNHNTDLGMCLDLAFGHYTERLEDCAKSQRTCTRLMQQHARSDLGLINVVHGSTTKQIARYQDIVYDKSISSMALGGVAESTVAHLLNKSLEVLPNHQHVHYLGVSNLTAVLPIIWLAHGLGIRVTSDSSTAVQAANNKIYLHQASMSNSPKRLTIGDLANFPSTSHLLPCSCPVCKAIKYADVLSVLDGALYRHLMVIHNVWEMLRYTLMMTDLAAVLRFSEFKRLAGSHAGMRDKVMMLDALDFAEEYLQSGKDRARQRFSSKLGTSLFGGQGSSSNLFNGLTSKSTVQKQTTASSSADQSSETDNDKAWRDRLDKLIVMYKNPKATGKKFGTSAGLSKSKLLKELPKGSSGIQLKKRQKVENPDGKKHSNLSRINRRHKRK